MSKILKVQDLYDSYNDSHFGYLGINLDTKEVNLYSDDARKQKGDIVYKINQNDEDFYWEFYHNGEYKRFGVSNLSEEYQKLIIELFNKQVSYSKEHGHNINIASDIINNLGLNFDEEKFTDEIPYYILHNDIFILNLPVLLVNNENEEVPTKEQIEEYKNLKAAIDVYHMLPIFGKGRYYEEREKKYKCDKVKIASEEMEKVRKYLESQKENRKEKIKCLNSILFGLGEIKNSSILLDEEQNLVKIRIGFYEDILSIEDIKKTDDDNDFIFTTPTYIRSNRRGENLELVFNDLECRDIDKNYKSVINQTYGPLLDFITDGKLRQARYNGGINEFHKIMFEIIPDVNVSEELLDLIENGNSDEEVFKQLTIYAESIIENKKLEGEELYNFIKKCKILGSNDIRYEGNSFTEYIESNPQFAKVSNIYRKLVSINKGKKIYNLVETINKYAKENPASLELQILDIFAQKYLAHYRIEVIGSKLSIGNMMLEMQAHRIEDEAIEYTEDGRTLKEPHGITRKKLEELEDRFYIFLPEKLKYALINEENMELEMNKIFGNYEEKGIKDTFKRIRNNIKEKI